MLGRSIVETVWKSFYIYLGRIFLFIEENPSRLKVGKQNILAIDALAKNQQRNSGIVGIGIQLQDKNLWPLSLLIKL